MGCAGSEEKKERQQANTDKIAEEKPGDIPECILTFYDKILSNPGTHGQDKALIASCMADDWQTRPNPLNPVEGTGPTPEGLVGIMGLWSAIMPDIKVERQQTYPISDGSGKWIVQSKFSATMGPLPEGMPEYPMFSGVAPDKITGKKFCSMAMDIQMVHEGKIKRTWHMEDWADALDQILTGRGAPSLENPPWEGGAALTEVPQCIADFYDKILSNPGTDGQDEALIAKTLDADWNTRPNPLNPIEGTGPLPAGLKMIMGAWSVMIPDMKIERKQTLLCGDKVVVLSEFSTTMNDPPPFPEGATEFPFFPGLAAADHKGKKITSMALDIQCIKDGKIIRTWHMEDWGAARDQLLKEGLVVNFGFDEAYTKF